MKKSLVPTLLSIVVLMLIWETIALVIGYPAIFPDLKSLFTGIIHIFGTQGFYSAIGATILRGIAGFLLAFVAAFGLATLSGFSVFWKAFFHPWLVVLRSVPVISVTLIALLWFRPDNLPVFIALITMFPILYQAILNGLEHTDPKLVEMAQVFGKSRTEIFVCIYLPSARNIIFGGISTAMGFGWRAIIIGEVLAQPIHGIGTGMKQAQAYINIPEVISWTVIAITISYLFDFLIKKLIKTPIHYRKRSVVVRSRHLNKSKKISISNLVKNFGEKVIFSGLTDSFSDTEVNCIKSPSGIGKTTLLRIISGIDKSYQGLVVPSGEFSIAYSFQDNRLIPWLNVRDNIRFVTDTKIAEDKITYLLGAAGMQDLGSKYPAELSGGQQQRVELIRALAAQSHVLLLDEPLNGLDEAIKNQIVELIDSWTMEYNPLIIWATHENIRMKKAAIREILLPQA